MSFHNLSSILCFDYDFLCNFTLCISNDYYVYSFGYCEYGAYGFKKNKINIPSQINNLINIKMIDCGFDHTICLDYNGLCFSFGYNDYGQLGIGKDNNELKFTYIPQKINIPPCKQVSCSYKYSICLTEDGYLYSFGNNEDSILGLGNHDDSYYITPQKNHLLNNIEYIICCNTHIICRSYNIYYAWGSTFYYQLTQNDNNYKPIECYGWPDDIINIKSGIEHSLLLTSEGCIYSFGRNMEGQLGINNNDTIFTNDPTLINDIPEIQRIECGNNHSICIDINNNLWLFGNNEYGQLGLGDTEDKYKPIIHPTLSNIIDISSGGDHTFVKTIDNKIYAFGKNNHSQLGIKTSEDYQLTPIQVFIDNEDIWCSFIAKSKAKSARK